MTFVTMFELDELNIDEICLLLRNASGLVRNLHETFGYIVPEKETQIRKTRSPPSSLFKWNTQIIGIN